MSIFVVAEVGINHNGDMSICKELIDVAVDAGCDAVKFQKRDINQVYTQEFLDSPRESPWETHNVLKKRDWNLIKSNTWKSLNIVPIKALSGLLLHGIQIAKHSLGHLIVSTTKLHQR